MFIKSEISKNLMKYKIYSVNIISELVLKLQTKYIQLRVVSKNTTLKYKQKRLYSNLFFFLIP